MRAPAGLTLMLLAMTVSGGATRLIRADDWPQWRGPARNAISAETGLATTFAPGGPLLKWTFTDTGIGYSGPAVVGQRLYIMGATGTAGDGYNEFVLCLDTATGHPIWKTLLAEYPDNIILPAWGHGPRATPTVATAPDGAGVVVVEGVNGDVAALAGDTGRVLWRLNLRRDFGGGQAGARGKAENTWGFSESPLVDQGRVIVTPGGSRGAIVALDLLTGNVVWTAKTVTDMAQYASPVIATFGGVRQYVQLLAGGLVSVAADDGRQLWRAAIAVNEIAMIPTPIIVGEDGVYAVSDYGTGGGLVRVSRNEAGLFTAVVVYDNKVMQNHHGGVVAIDGHAYGWSGNSNSRGGWICQNLATGDQVWRDESLPCGSLIAAGGHLYCYTQTDGTLACVRPTPEGWRELGRFGIPRQTQLKRNQGKIWTHPVIANGRLYLRDLDLLFCFDLTAPASGGNTPPDGR